MIATPKVKDLEIHLDYFTVTVNGRQYIGSFFWIGALKAMTGLKEVNSEKQTTWRIKTFVESELNR